MNKYSLFQNIPKISIVTPSYNQANFLEQTIQSIINQQYPNIEYVIIDGGSNDGSVDIIKKYESYLHFWCSEPDEGQYDAINKGFKHTTGEIMAWLNSDDMYYPWAFKTVADIMSTIPQVEWLTTLSLGGWDYHGFCNGFGNISGYSREAFLDGVNLPSETSKGLSSCWIQQESTFWRRNLWEKTGGFVSTQFKLAGDFELWARFYDRADLVGVVSPLGGFRNQFGQKSRQMKEAYILEAEKILGFARDQSNWTSYSLGGSFRRWKLNRIPKLRTFLRNNYGYVGKKVARKNIDSPDAFWQLEEYRYL